MGADGKKGAPRRRYVRFTRWRRAHFFRVLEETGHARMTAEAARVSLGCIYRLRRAEAGFAERMAAAVEAADASLRRGRPGGNPAAVTGPDQQALVIRRGRGGRLRVMAAGARWWTERHDSAFLDHLRSTGNIAASARAAGFTAKSAWNRRERLPGFARAMDESREDADLELEFRLAARARGRSDDDFGGPEAGFDPDQAIRTLSFRAHRSRGRHAPRRRPPAAIEAVTRRVEKIVRAIRRRRDLKP